MLRYRSWTSSGFGCVLTSQRRQQGNILPNVVGMCNLKELVLCLKNAAEMALGLHRYPRAAYAMLLDWSGDAIDDTIKERKKNPSSWSCGFCQYTVDWSLQFVFNPFNHACILGLKMYISTKSIVRDSTRACVQLGLPPSGIPVTWFFRRAQVFHTDNSKRYILTYARRVFSWLSPSEFPS